MNTSQTAPTQGGNRITFTSQQLPNGTINITGQQGGGGPTIISTTQLPNTTTIKTITSNASAVHHPGMPQQVQVQHHQVLQTAGGQGNAQQHQQQQQQQHQQQQQQSQSVGATQTQTLVIKSNHHAVTLPAGLVSSAPGIVTMTKTINQGTPQLLNSMLPAGVVVGMRPPTAPQQQKNMQSNQLGRVVISNSHMVGARPQSPSITLNTLNTGQTPALLLKTDNGYQLLRVGPATSTGPTVTQTIGTNSTNPTQIRLQTVPASSMANTSSANNIVVNSVATSNAQQHSYNTQQQQPHLQQQQHHVQQQQQHQQQQQQMPQITQIQTIQTQQQQQQQQQNTQQSNTISINNNNNISTTVTTTSQQSTAAQGNTKEKCRKFLANLIDLSTREPKPVERNVRNLIQELVNANVEPEEFCDRLERLLNASPQPCLIGFLKKSLPLLRQALFNKELIIEGIKAPPQHVLGMSALQQQLPKIQAQIRPISQSQTTTIGQTQVRMISQPGSGPRPIGHTTITKQPPGLRIQATPNGPRLVSPHLRGQIPATIQQTSGAPQLQAGQTHANIVQIRGPSGPQLQRPTGAVQIRTTKAGGGGVGGGAGPANKLTAVKVGQTQIKAIPGTPGLHSNQPPSLAAISNNGPPTPTLSASTSILSTINSVASSGSGLPIPSLPTVQLPPAALLQRENLLNSNAALSNLHHHHNSLTSGGNSVGGGHAAEFKIEPKLIDIKGEKITATLTPIANKVTTTKATTASGSKAAAKKKKETHDKDKDEKVVGAHGSTSAAAASAYFQQNSISMSSSMYGDDDINDVAAMGGVNLAEESQRILGCTENIGTQIRSCKDEVFLNLPALQARIRALSAERGLEEPSQDVAVLISHACQERLKTIVEKLAVIAEHRIDVIKLDPRYEPAKDVRGQIKFLEELDKAEQKKHEEIEREMLLRAAKSRSRVEDPEQAKMKARAKEMQRAEMEELRQRDANLTALQAIGPRKKLKLDSEAGGTGSGSMGGGLLGSTSTAPTTLRPRIKRVNLRDMLYYMEQERETCRSEMLYKAYLK